MYKIEGNKLISQDLVDCEYEVVAKNSDYILVKDFYDPSNDECLDLSALSIVDLFANEEEDVPTKFVVGVYTGGIPSSFNVVFPDSVDAEYLMTPELFDLFIKAVKIVKKFNS